MRAARKEDPCRKRVLVISDSTYRELILRRSNRNDTDTNVEPGGRGSNYVGSVSLSAV